MVAGYAAKEFVERGGKKGDLVILSADSHLPYERPPLSKGFLGGKDDPSTVLINPPPFYREHGIEVRLETVVKRIDAASKKLVTEKGDVAYDKLLLAPGARPRTLDGARVLRTLSDALAIRGDAEKAKSALVLGGGFIGMEVSATLAHRGIKTTLAFPEKRVMERIFSPEMSAFFQEYYAARGVTIVAGNKPGTFPHAADIVVAGIGVTPVVDVAQSAGCTVDNGIVVNAYLETNVPGIWAAGDAARYEDVLFKKQRRVEHWDNAVEQGKHAMRAMLGERARFEHVPYFFSDVFDLSYELWGDADGADATTVRGDMKSASFSVWWTKAGKVVSVFVMRRDDAEREAAQAAVREGNPVPA
jgi:NADPH-dependent 2,4-dienoyl-CoA reductase/sulfur reductase-like enzyme